MAAEKRLWYFFSRHQLQYKKFIGFVKRSRCHPVKCGQTREMIVNSRRKMCVRLVNEHVFSVSNKTLTLEKNRGCLSKSLPFAKDCVIDSNKLTPPPPPLLKNQKEILRPIYYCMLILYKYTIYITIRLLAQLNLCWPLFDYVVFLLYLSIIDTLRLLTCSNILCIFWKKNDALLLKIIFSLLIHTKIVVHDPYYHLPRSHSL